MTIFNLPDLGEGLLEAEIHEWYVKEGDSVQQDQPIVSMETAKAVVDVPAPQAGVIKKLYGHTGSIVRTGTPLIEFEAHQSETVVGRLEEKTDIHLNHLPTEYQSQRPKASLATRNLANQLGVTLSQVTASGEFGVITATDVQQYAQTHTSTRLSGHTETLSGVRRQMAIAMENSHRSVVAVTLYDDADISSWQPPFDITIRLIQAIICAIQTEPALNAWFDGRERRLFSELNLGLAVDTAEGLFVPVIMNAQDLTPTALRQEIEQLKIQVNDRSLPPQKFQNASFSLSNFGKFAGKYASPIVVPPMVAILAVGRIYQLPTPEFKVANKLPLSLSFDHRAVTGGEATRFLGAIMHHLEQP